MIKPRKILQNSCIGIYSPSEPITENRKERVAQGINVIHQNGFRVKLGTNVFAQRYYMAGEPACRAQDVNQLIKDENVDILLASWGGKSCNQILPLIDFDLIKKSRKPILGFSDGCVLLNAITAKTNLFTFHGPNVAGKFFETKHPDLSILIKDFYEDKVNLLGKTENVNFRILKKGKCQGRLFGGNLSTFVLGLLGSEYIPKFKEGIFFWESAGETPQIIDQFLTCLKNAGIFNFVKGMIIGDFIREETEKYKARDPFDAILDIFNDFNFPILHCPTFGHPGHLENPVIPIGPMCELNAKEVSLYLLESVIE